MNRRWLPFRFWRSCCRVRKYSDPAASKGIEASPENVLITSGSQQGLDLLAHTIMEPGTVVGVEDPGYTDARHTFVRAGAELELAPAEDIIEWAAATFGSRFCITSSMGDAVLAVSFSPYNSITPDLVAVARERGATIVAVTDSTFSPLVQLADEWVEVVESDFAGFRSLAASLAVGMALVNGVAEFRRDRGTVQ